MLVQGRVSIVQALGCARTVLTSNNLQEEAFALERYIDAGHTFNQASTKLTQFLMPDVWAMLDVGQESGRLGDLSLSAAERYKELVARRLLLITTVIQPVLMLLLGFGIIGIILSVYMPIFNLSSVIA
jgi:type II secretory pathway component PulF